MKAFSGLLRLGKTNATLGATLNATFTQNVAFVFHTYTTFDATFVPPLKQCNSIFNKNIKTFFCFHHRLQEMHFVIKNPLTNV